MHHLQDWLQATVTYLIAIISMHSDSIVSWLGFILLIARLVQEVPKAIRVVQKYLNGKKTR